MFFFFFSSRRRHTRCLSDWSSDVCSSDLLWSAQQSHESAADRRLEPAGRVPLAREIGRASCRESVDLGGRRIIKKKKKKSINNESNTQILPSYNNVDEGEL